MDEKRVDCMGGKGGVRPRLSPKGGSDSPHVPPKGKSLPKECGETQIPHAMRQGGKFFSH